MLSCFPNFNQFLSPSASGPFSCPLGFTSPTHWGALGFSPEIMAFCWLVLEPRRGMLANMIYDPYGMEGLQREARLDSLQSQNTSVFTWVCINLRSEQAHEAVSMVCTVGRTSARLSSGVSFLFWCLRQTGELRCIQVF